MLFSRVVYIYIYKCRCDRAYTICFLLTSHTVRDLYLVSCVSLVLCYFEQFSSVTDDMVVTHLDGGDVWQSLRGFVLFLHLSGGDVVLRCVVKAT